MEVNKNDNAPITANRWTKDMDLASLEYWFDYYTGFFQNAIDTQLLPKDHVLLTAIKYNIRNEGRGEHLKALYDDILEYQGETNPLFLEPDLNHDSHWTGPRLNFEPQFCDGYNHSNIPFGDSYKESPKSEVQTDEDGEEWEEHVLSRSQINFIGEALKAWVKSKDDKLNAAETADLNCLLESLYG